MGAVIAFIWTIFGLLLVFGFLLGKNLPSTPTFNLSPLQITQYSHFALLLFHFTPIFTKSYKSEKLNK
jgi:hypothetical protein